MSEEAEATLRKLTQAFEKIRMVRRPSRTERFAEGLADVNEALRTYQRGEKLLAGEKLTGAFIERQLWPAAVSLAGRFVEENPADLTVTLMERYRSPIMETVARLIPIVIENVDPQRLNDRNNYLVMAIRQLNRDRSTSHSPTDQPWEEFYKEIASLSHPELTVRLEEEYARRRQKESAPIPSSALPRRDPELFKHLPALAAENFTRLCSQMARSCGQYLNLRGKAKTNILAILSLDGSDPQRDAMVTEMGKLRDYAAKAYHEKKPEIISLQAFSVLAGLPVEKMDGPLARAWVSALNGMVMACPGTVRIYPRLTELLVALRRSADPELNALAKQCAADWQAWSGVELQASIERQVNFQARGVFRKG